MDETGLYQAFEAADRRARIRDIENRVNVDVLARELRKVEENKLMLLHKRDRNRACFVQVLSDNLNYLVASEYLTTSERAFLFSLQGRVEMHSNAIVDDNGRYMTVTEIAEATKYSVRQARTLVTSLLEKGILLEFVDAQQLKRFGRIVEERPLYMNPEIFYNGDRNRINATLCRLVINADPLERRKILLPWKIWLEPKAEFGRLYARKTWFKKRREARL